MVMLQLIPVSTFGILLVLLTAVDNGDASFAERRLLLDRLTSISLSTENSVRSAAATTSGTTVCVLESKRFPEAAFDVADRLSLPLLSTNEILEYEKSKLRHVVSVGPYNYANGNVQDYAIGISLIDQPASPRKKKRRATISSMKPLFVDFLPPPTSRLGRRTGQPDLLLQAVKGVKDAVIYDLTAGLGQDSLLMACAGAGRVHMIERDPIVATLLQDALRRLQVLSEAAESDLDTKDTASKLLDCMSLQCGDAVELLEQSGVESSFFPDIVYLDPMFPARKKNASVRKNMQVLHSLLGSQEIDDEALQNDQAVLLRSAHQAAKARVVVKRPIHAPPLLPEEELRPDYSVTGSISRWDVYIKS